jgi:monoamine oxidase
MKNNGKKTIVIIGGSFAGLTAAYEIGRNGYY